MRDMMQMKFAHLYAQSHNPMKGDVTVHFATTYLVPVEDLGHAAVRHAELPRNDARPHAGRRHFHDLEPDVVGKRAAVDEHAAQLVHAALSYLGKVGESARHA